MGNICRTDCQAKYFGFGDVKPEKFYESQWCSSRLVFLVYKILIFAYALAWIIADVTINNQPNYWIFLTNWSEVTGCLYFLLSLILVIYGYAIRNKEQTDQGLKWFHILVWILYTTALTGVLATDIAFWALLSRNSSASFLSSPFNIHEHAIDYVLLLIDLFVNKIPLRLLHFVYPIGYGLVYTIFTVILWAADYRDAVYDVVLDWERFPGNATLITMLFSFIALPLIHVLWHFWLFKLRSLIAESWWDSKNRKQQPIDDNVEMNEQKDTEKTNEAY